jgi:hypothetical protein
MLEVMKEGSSSQNSVDPDHHALIVIRLGKPSDVLAEGQTAFVFALAQKLPC